MSTAPGSVRRFSRWGLQHALPGAALRLSHRRGDPQAAVFSADTEAELLAALDRVRAAGRLSKGRLAYVTVSHAASLEVLSSNDFAVGTPRSRLPATLRPLSDWAVRDAPIGPLTPPSLLAVEPPDHTRYRKLVTRVFTARAIQQLRDRTVEIADGLLDELDAHSEVDLVEQYCSKLPVTMIAEILGVPVAERDQILAFGEKAAPSLDLGLPWTAFSAVESALYDFAGWLDRHIVELRENPRDDLLSQLVAVRDEQGGLDDQELKATAGLILAAGFETTVNLLGNGARLLLAHPEQLAGLLAGDADGTGTAWTNAVNEILRFDPPVLLTGRTAVRDTQVAGRSVPAGNTVLTVLAGANRDPDVFEAPAVFDVTRHNAADHLAFSNGRHYCLGAALARMEGEVGLSRLFRRFPEMRLLPGAQRRETRILRGYRVLPVRLR
jgi:cytochrome P450